MIKINEGLTRPMTFCRVGTIDVESNYDELVASGEYQTDWLDNCFAIYVPLKDEIPYIAYHFYSGTIRVVGCEQDFCTDYIDVVGHFLTHGTVDGLFE